MAMPKDVKSIWDNEGKTLDRYTVVLKEEHSPGNLLMLGLSTNPTHPQGFSQFTGGHEGDHLGKKIEWSDLPKNIQEHVTMRLKDDDVDVTTSIIKETLAELAIVSENRKGMPPVLKTLIDEWEKTGRVAYYHAIKKTVSLNGGRAMPEKEAIKYLQDWKKNLDLPKNTQGHVTMKAVKETLAELVTSEADQVAARELEIYIDNDADIYEKYKMPLFKMLTKKMQNGTYDHARAARAFVNMVDMAAHKYAKEYADPKEWNIIFTPETRKKVMEGLVDEFEAVYKNKEYDFMKDVEAAAPFRKYVNIHEEGTALRPDSFYIKEIDKVLENIAEIDKETAKELDEKLAKVTTPDLKVWLEKLKQAYNDMV
jgi:hypothetical protein